ncbi:hypothetical protein [Caryophanon latum]|uniref:Uncharacterized protein n=1 Tax=Caryophanon latum TaxID=33977 RepID=A0A1C0Z2N8_9BACL|nr:hypothetical protein [Caryophanon latum]OCS93663.1 hypothetical protein A6K76_04840 [Caryophanon latum]
MRKPLKIYLFLLLLITAFGILGNILIQDEPNLQATDINADIPGSETMVALYEQLATTFGENAIFDIAVLPVDDRFDAELLLIANVTDEQTLLADTEKALRSIEEITLRHVTISWQMNDATVMHATFASPFDTTAETIAARAIDYTYTP